jgi:c-di-GMP-binding flagellar brake protein YcgR
LPAADATGPAGKERHVRYCERERREFVRVEAEVPVHYRFLSHDAAFTATEPVEGRTANISGGGLLLSASIPDPDWVSGLLTGRIFVGVKVELPGSAKPVKALTRAAWIEPVQGTADGYLLGLRFKEITRDDLDRVFGFVIERQID